MAQIDITKISSKGQIVIPKELRYGMKEGDKLMIIRDADTLILKRTEGMDKQLQEDLEFARRTEKAWQNIKTGKGKSYTPEEFIKEIRKIKESR